MIFSSLPDWFWSENLGEIEHQCIHAETDIGLIQKSPFHHDLDLTAKAWMSFISFSNENFDRCLHGSINSNLNAFSVTFHLLVFG